MRKKTYIILGIIVVLLSCVFLFRRWDSFVDRNNPKVGQRQLQPFSSNSIAQEKTWQNQPQNSEPRMKNIPFNKKEDIRNMALGKTLVKGILLYADGQPVPHAILQVYKGKENGISVIHTHNAKNMITGTITDSTAHFVLEFPDTQKIDNPYNVLVKLPLFGAQKEEDYIAAFSLSLDSLTLNFEKGKTIDVALKILFSMSESRLHGYVYGALGEGLRNFEIHSPYGPHMGIALPWSYQTGNQFVMYANKIPSFVIEAEGYAPQLIEGVEVHDKNQEHIVKVYLEKGAELQGIVKNEQGYPISGATVTFESPPDDFHMSYHTLTTETDALGFFRLEHISQEMDYVLKIEHPDYEELTKEFKDEYFKYNLTSQHEFSLKKQ